MREKLNFWFKIALTNSVWNGNHRKFSHYYSSWFAFAQRFKFILQIQEEEFESLMVIAKKKFRPWLISFGKKVFSIVNIGGGGSSDSLSNITEIDSFAVQTNKNPNYLELNLYAIQWQKQSCIEKKIWIQFISCNLNRLDFDFGHKVLWLLRSLLWLPAELLNIWTKGVGNMHIKCDMIPLILVHMCIKNWIFPPRSGGGARQTANTEHQIHLISYKRPWYISSFTNSLIHSLTRSLEMQNVLWLKIRFTSIPSSFDMLIF